MFTLTARSYPAGFQTAATGWSGLCGSGVEWMVWEWSVKDGVGVECKGSCGVEWMVWVWSGEDGVGVEWSVKDGVGVEWRGWCGCGV